jgi:tryptophan-rich sensory protein
MYRDWISLLIFFGICFAVGASGSAFTASSYGAWVLYASYLNFGIWRLNKGTT